MTLTPKLLILVSLAALFLGMAGDGFCKQDAREAQQALARLQTQFAGAKAYELNGRATKLYGRAFGSGVSPEAAAASLVQEYAAVFGAKAADLKPISLMADQRQSQPLMYNPVNGEYKFTLVCYSQFRDEVPVFRADLRLLVRNKPGYPIVLATSALRPLGDFSPLTAAAPRFDLAQNAVLAEFPQLTEFSEPQMVIWAGYNSIDEEPTLAIQFEAYNDKPERWLFLADAATGEILYREDRIIFDVVGSVSGLATQGIKAEHCEEEESEALRWARVEMLSTVGYTNQFGSFILTYFGGGPVDVTSYLWGEYFRVYNYTGTDAEITVQAYPPTPISFLHNESNTEPYRAQVNAYIEANDVRDMVLVYNPAYPDVSTQFEFPVYVNRVDGYCPGNAWYDPGDESINFCSSGGGHPNTAWAPVVHHEYGHHLVEVAGSGQGQYGEGMSDCMGILLADDPGLAYGFDGDCDVPLRNADNTYQYPCSGGIHDCGQLISGCIWDTRNALIVTLPETYMDTLANLTVNSILLHTGSEITPQITIDFLTLDDDDENLDNGTPHYNEICAGFSVHNMDCPDLALISFIYPEGIPNFIQPNTTTAVKVDVVATTVDPVPGSGKLYYSLNGGAWVQGTMNELSANHYEAMLPAVDCGTGLKWYVSAEAEGYGEVTDPQYAPAESYTMVIATAQAAAFVDDFESDQGWTISGGLWARGSPTGDGGQYGNPDPVGGHLSANCLAYNLNGDYENYLDEMHVTSPALDCSNFTGTHLKFQRWLGVESPSYDHAYIRVSTDGSSWTTVWANDSYVEDGSWQEMEYDLSAIADDEATVYVRFTMGETDGSWRYCGWNIDDLQVSGYLCETSSDSDGDGIIDALDNCPITYNPDQEDADIDEVGDSCDLCTDLDGDGFGDPGYPANICDEDNCPAISNPLQADADSDGAGDSCDVCTDTDGDGYGDPNFPANTCELDNCPSIENPDQADPDEDSIGTACDNCPNDYNPDQADADEDGIGDACDFTCGDCNNDGMINVSDAVFLISFIFAGGPPPPGWEYSADVDCSTEINVSDAVYLLSFIFSGGPEPCAACP